MLPEKNNFFGTNSHKNCSSLLTLSTSALKFCLSVKREDGALVGVGFAFGILTRCVREKTRLSLLKSATRYHCKLVGVYLGNWGFKTVIPQDALATVK